MRIACLVSKAADTDSEYTILIAFPRQHRLRENTSVAVHCLVSRTVNSFKRSLNVLYMRR